MCIPHPMCINGSLGEFSPYTRSWRFLGRRETANRARTILERNKGFREKWARTSPLRQKLPRGGGGTRRNASKWRRRFEQRQRGRQGVEKRGRRWIVSWSFRSPLMNRRKLCSLTFERRSCRVEILAAVILFSRRRKKNYGERRRRLHPGTYKEIFAAGEGGRGEMNKRYTQARVCPSKLCVILYKLFYVNVILTRSYFVVKLSMLNTHDGICDVWRMSFQSGESAYQWVLHAGNCKLKKLCVVKLCEAVYVFQEGKQTNVFIGIFIYKRRATSRRDKLFMCNTRDRGFNII